VPEILIHAEPLRRIAQRIFVAAGCSPEEGARIAHHLVLSNLTGHDSHGVIRIPRYLKWVENGSLRPNQTATMISESAGMALLEGNFGFGQSLGPEAVAIGINKAKAAGVAVVALRHSGHLGRIGEWAEMAAAAGLVSIHFVNVSGSTLVAPFGSSERRMSTNPIAIGVPRTDGPPLIFDATTSVVAEGKIAVAFSGGKPLPAGSLIDRDGRLSSDPAIFYGPKQPGLPSDSSKGSGAIRAVGEHKGSGLSFMVDLLAGALTGSGCSGPPPRPFANGMLSIYLKPEIFDRDGRFAAEVREYLRFFKSAKPVKAGDEVLAPGEPELNIRAAREARGIPLSEEAWHAILSSGERLGLDRKHLEKIAGVSPE
jgi:uncharacterized oxidoreductase